MLVLAKMVRPSVEAPFGSHAPLDFQHAELPQASGPQYAPVGGFPHDAFVIADIIFLHNKS